MNPTCREMEVFPEESGRAFRRREPQENRCRSWKARIEARLEMSPHLRRPGMVGYRTGEGRVCSVWSWLPRGLLWDPRSRLWKLRERDSPGEDGEQAASAGPALPQVSREMDGIAPELFLG